MGSPRKDKKKRPLGQRIASTESRQTQAERALLAERAKKYDPRATTEQMIEDLRRIQEAEPARHITRNFYREHGKYSDQTWVNRFGTFHEFRREAGLEHHRGAQRIERKIAIHAARDRYRGFAEVELLPWAGKYEKHHRGKGMKRVLAASDFHDRHSDPFCLEVFIDTARRVQPEVLVFHGDLFEFSEFGRFDIDPRTVNVRAAFEFVRDRIFRPIREACPHAQIDFILGNHDLRVFRHMADRTPYLAPLLDLMGVSLARLFGLDEFQINLVSKADLSAYLPKEAKEELAKNYKVYFNSLLIGHFPGKYGIPSVAGHTHKPAYSSDTNERVGDHFQLTTGCMAGVDFSYVQGLNRYQQSFALFHIDPELREVVPEHIVFTHHYAVVGGVVYRRTKKQGAAA